MAINASKLVVAYFVIGAVMLGGGALEFDEAGIVTHYLNEGDAGNISPDPGVSEDLGGVGNAIQSVIQTVMGPLLIIWKLVSGFIKFVHWPIYVMIGAEVPTRVMVLLGGAPVVMFYMGLVRMVRSSA